MDTNTNESNKELETVRITMMSTWCTWLLVLWALLLLLVSPHVANSLPLGFVKEFVVKAPAVTGRWASNPRKNGKPMLIIASDSGRLRALENPDESDETVTILDLRLEEQEICTNGERGLQSIAIHPNFDENRWVYLFYTSYREGCFEGPEISPYNAVDRYAMNPKTLELDKATKEEIWRGAPTSKQNHNGGALAFGNDGKLYVTTGDGGDGKTAQPLNNTHGSIIRLNDDGSVPTDNPFADPNDFDSYRCADSGGTVPNDAPENAVCSEVFANGLRNPFRIAMDPNKRDTVRFAVSDVGGNYWEELSWAGTEFAGRNYGYPTHEGPCVHGYSDRCQLPDDQNILEPFHWYAHRRLKEGGCVAGSVFVPENSGWPADYEFLFADFIFFEIYNVIEDPDAYCRDCRPPLPGYRNETFYEVPVAEEKGSITDIFFGPYKNMQALYVILRGGKESVIRIRYTADVDNAPPVPVIELNDLEYDYIVGEQFSFVGSGSSDPDGDELEFVWDFDDGTSSIEKNPTHSFQEPGEYKVTLVVTDVAGISQQTSMIIRVGKPPTVSIISPMEGDEFFVGQIFQLRGEAFDNNGERLDDSSLTWEVRKHHADHFHPFLDPTQGNDLELFPAPEPEDFFAATNSYLRIILKATDVNGLTTEVDRLVQPLKLTVVIESNLPGIELTVDAYPLTTSEQIVSWKSHKLNVLAQDQMPFLFRSWWDGNTERERKITLQNDRQSVLVIYCTQPYWFCSSDEECCSGSCKAMYCVSDITGIDSSGFLVEEIGNDSKLKEKENEEEFELVSVSEGMVLGKGYTNQSLDDDLDSEIYDEVVSSRSSTTRSTNATMDDATSYTGSGATGMALNVIPCGTILIIALLIGYSIAKRKKKKVPGANGNDDIKHPKDECDSNIYSRDEEAGPSDKTNANASAAGTDIGIDILKEVHSEGSGTSSDREGLNNNTYETSSSSSS